MNEEKSILAARINQMRKELNLTQEELAFKLGLKGKSSIANYESGKITPSDEIKIKMCEIFNCSMDYLMGLSSHVNPKEELEKELYKFDLTEDEYYDAINCFMKNDVRGLSFIMLFADEKMVETKEYTVLLTILSYVSDYISNIHLPNDKTSIDPLVRQNFEIELEKAYMPAKRLLLSLDKRKVIHNYNDIITAEKCINKDLYKKEINLDGSVSYSEKYYMCPVYGQISAGQPNWAEECIEGRLPIDPDLMGIVNPEEHFFLRVNGESMNNVVKNGAFALIHKQDFVDDGEIAAVLVNGYDATLKRFTKKGNVIVLEPDSNDSSFKTQIYDKTTSIKILGKYVGKMEINK